MNNEPNTPDTHTTPDSTQPLTPTPTAPPLTPPTVEVTPAPDPTPAPRSSKKKLLIIISGVVLLIAALIAVGVYLKNSADTAAKNYALAIDRQFDGFFEETDRAKRLEILNDKVELAPVLLGSTLSESYRDVSETLTPLYDESVVVSEAATKAAMNNMKDFRNFLREYTDASRVTIAESDKQLLGINVGQIESEIEKHFKVVDLLHVAAGTLEKATQHATLPSFKETVHKIHDLAEIRQANGVFAAQYYNSLVVQTGTQMDERIKQIVLSHDKNAFDTTLTAEQLATAPTKIKQLAEKYVTASESAVDSTKKLADEVLGQSDAAMEKINQLDEKLKAFAPAEELDKESNKK